MFGQLVNVEGLDERNVRKMNQTNECHNKRVLIKTIITTTEQCHLCEKQGTTVTMQKKDILVWFLFFMSYCHDFSK